VVGRSGRIWETWNSKWDTIVLLGSYRLSLDDKGRLSIPAILRQAMRELYADDKPLLVVTKYFEHCLVVYPKAEWLGIQEQLLALRSDAGSRAFIRQLCASASLCPLDRQGRILVPAKLRQYAGIDSEALVIGTMNKLEIWSPSRWEAYDDKESPRFESRTRSMELKL
jgi:MraZ protein